MAMITAELKIQKVAGQSVKGCRLLKLERGLTDELVTINIGGLTYEVNRDEFLISAHKVCGSVALEQKKF